MPEALLLDTNIVIALFKNEPVVLEFLVGKRLYLPVIVLGELYFGAQRSSRVIENTERAKAFADRILLLTCDAETADHYGQIKHRLMQQGRPIPENDLWIAALAIQHSLPLFTRDRHFELIEGLQLSQEESRDD